MKYNPNIKRKWYKNPVFPLIPMLTVKKESEHCTSGFTFEWLIFRVWSLDSFNFELGVTISDHWGVGIIAILPYLRIVACIPCPEFITTKSHKFLDRSTKKTR